MLNFFVTPPTFIHVQCVALLAFLFVSCTGAELFEGWGTTYGAKVHKFPSGGNCNFQQLNPNEETKARIYYAALNNAQWEDLQNCGRCARVRCTDNRCQRKDNWVTVIILDQCPECGHGGLDLSPKAFEEVTGNTPARLSIQWEFTDCPEDYIKGPIQYCLKGGSNGFWAAIQPTNFKTRVTKMEINGEEATLNNMDAYYYLRKTSGGMKAARGSGPWFSDIEIVLHSDNGESLTDRISFPAQENVCIPGTIQFQVRGSSPSISAPTPGQVLTAQPTATVPTNLPPSVSASPSPIPTTVIPALPVSTTTVTPTLVPTTSTLLPLPYRPAVASPAPSSSTTPNVASETPTTNLPRTRFPASIIPNTTAPIEQSHINQSQLPSTMISSTVSPARGPTTAVPTTTITRTLSPLTRIPITPVRPPTPPPLGSPTVIPTSASPTTPVTSMVTPLTRVPSTSSPNSTVPHMPATVPNTNLNPATIPAAATKPPATSLPNGTFPFMVEAATLIPSTNVPITVVALSMATALSMTTVPLRTVAHRSPTSMMPTMITSTTPIPAPHSSLVPAAKVVATPIPNTTKPTTMLPARVLPTTATPPGSNIAPLTTVPADPIPSSSNSEYPAETAHAPTSAIPINPAPLELTPISIVPTALPQANTQAEGKATSFDIGTFFYVILGALVVLGVVYFGYRRKQNKALTTAKESPRSPSLPYESV